MESPTIKITGEVIEHFAKRSESLRRAANFTFLMIIVFCVGGGAFFFYAAFNATSVQVPGATAFVVGMIAFLFFIQLLVSLYRYNVRVAYHHRAVAEAMRLNPATPEQLATLVSAISPSQFEFPDAPRLPIPTLPGS